MRDTAMTGVGRRDLLALGLALPAAVAAAASGGQARAGATGARRRLGTLEVSSVGLGVQT